MSIAFLGPNSMYEPITYSHYSDNTPMVKTLGFGRIAARADTVLVKAESLEEFVVAMFMVDSLNSHGTFIKRLVLPYVPGARQDRVNFTGDVLFTAASVASMINAREFDEVVILDPHSHRLLELINNVVVFPYERIAAKVPHGYDGYDGIISADHGGKARAEYFAKAMDLPIFYGGKTRDVSTGRLSGFTVEPLPEGGHFLVVDDICDGGGTFIGLAKKIQEYASADLFVSHGIFARGTDALREEFGTIFTTDSFARSPEGVTVIPVVQDMVEYTQEVSNA